MHSLNYKTILRKPFCKTILRILPALVDVHPNLISTLMPGEIYVSSVCTVWNYDLLYAASIYTRVVVCLHHWSSPWVTQCSIWWWLSERPQQTIDSWHGTQDETQHSSQGDATTTLNWIQNSICNSYRSILPVLVGKLERIIYRAEFSLPVCMI